ncbi:MAG: hypothetical protein CM1200mP20_17040 [Pseudomonadota bacterium]|nr:MAG: hypothetical protein CM1200mP20_17040 [Pseudomonadota bacterium]
MLCPGLRIDLKDESNPKNDTIWEYEDGLRDYLLGEIGDFDIIPAEPVIEHIKVGEQEADWAVSWLTDGGDVVSESYVNLIPTVQGVPRQWFPQRPDGRGRVFCEFRGLLPGHQICAGGYLPIVVSFSFRMKDPSSGGSPKGTASSRDAGVSPPAARDSFSLLAEPAHW